MYLEGARKKRRLRPGVVVALPNEHLVFPETRAIITAYGVRIGLLAEIEPEPAEPEPIPVTIEPPPEAVPGCGQRAPIVVAIGKSTQPLPTEPEEPAWVKEINKRKRVDPDFIQKLADGKAAEKERRERSLSKHFNQIANVNYTHLSYQ